MPALFLWQVFFQAEGSYKLPFAIQGALFLVSIFKKGFCISVRPAAMSSLHVRARTGCASAASSFCLGLYPVACSFSRRKETQCRMQWRLCCLLAQKSLPREMLLSEQNHDPPDQPPGSPCSAHCGPDTAGGTECEAGGCRHLAAYKTAALIGFS